MRSTDNSFVFSTWLKALYFDESLFRKIPQGIFFKNYQGILERLLTKEGNQTLLAVLEDDADVILAYACFSPTTLHFAYSKMAWRRMGLIKTLLPSTIVQVSHLTSQGERAKPEGWAFNPFAI